MINLLICFNVIKMHKVENFKYLCHGTIYLSIYEIYIAPLQGNYSEALPAQARAKIKVVRSL